MTLFSNAWAQTDWLKSCFYTGYSLSEALILASINPKYDNRLFVELRVQYKKTTSLVHSCCVYQIVFILTIRTI